VVLLPSYLGIVAVEKLSCVGKSGAYQIKTEVSSPQDKQNEPMSLGRGGCCYRNTLFSPTGPKGNAW